ncbi:MAG: hypothetical protein AB7I36_15240 [Rhodospirillaceae bacterium]
MPRRDQYGTHDEIGRGPRRSDAARNASEDVGDPRGRTPNYGRGNERLVRTSQSGSAQFQGRDYEREDYGAGYGRQRKSRDVPNAGRKAEWMHDSRKPKREWRGQVGGSGMDGLASERAFGSDSNEQMSPSNGDRAYMRWRDAELRGHDDDYRAWRQAQELRLDEDYARWKAARKTGRKRF